MIKVHSFLKHCSVRSSFYENKALQLMAAEEGFMKEPCLDKVKLYHTSNDVMWPKKCSNYMQRLKSAILAFFIQGWDDRALLVRPSRIPYRFSKYLSALGANEFLAMLERKVRVMPFFQGSIW